MWFLMLCSWFLSVKQFRRKLKYLERERERERIWKLTFLKWQSAHHIRLLFGLFKEPQLWMGWSAQEKKICVERDALTSALLFSVNTRRAPLLSFVSSNLLFSVSRFSSCPSLRCKTALPNIFQDVRPSIQASKLSQRPIHFLWFSSFFLFLRTPLILDDFSHSRFSSRVELYFVWIPQAFRWTFVFQTTNFVWMFTGWPLCQSATLKQRASKYYMYSDLTVTTADNTFVSWKRFQIRLIWLNSSSKFVAHE